jgi:FMN-dependent NADH-azoreductase
MTNNNHPASSTPLHQPPHTPSAPPRPRTLIVHYTPRGEQSNTRALALHFKECAKGHVAILDLEHTQLPFLNAPILAAYTKAAYTAQPLTEDEETLVAPLKKHVEEVLAADIVVLAFPMWNFGAPAAVKAWLDHVLWKGKTWDFAPGGGYLGLVKGKKGVILCTTGGSYDAPPMNKYDHATAHTRDVLQFMGLSVQIVMAQGLNQFPQEATARIEKAKSEIAALVHKLGV